MRTRYETDALSAEVSGFDHSTAFFSWFGIVFSVLPMFGVPVFFALPWVKALLSMVAFAVAVALCSLPLRYRVSVLADSLCLERSWAWLVYKRVTVPNGPDLKFDVWGTADWGDEGMWPAEHYCEVMSPGQHELMIGTPNGAHELAAWLTAQARRVALR